VLDSELFAHPTGLRDNGETVPPTTNK